MPDIQCPHCTHPFGIRAGLVKATCPKCVETFLVVEAELAAVRRAAEAEAAAEAAAQAKAAQAAQAKAAAAASAQTGAGQAAAVIAPPMGTDTIAPPPPPMPKPGTSAPRRKQATAWPAWINPYGVAAIFFGGMAFLSAVAVGLKPLTMGLFIAGVAAAGVGAALSQRRPSDIGWLAGGGSLCAVGLVLTMLAPGTLNPLWDMDFAISGGDPDQQMRVSRAQPREEGKLVHQQDWVDADKQAIRQDDVLVLVETVKSEPLPDKADKYLQVYVRLGNVGFGRDIAFEGFTRNKHVPVLKDDAGHDFVFVEERRRKRTLGLMKRKAGLETEFEPAPAQSVSITPNRHVDRQLIFEGTSDKRLKLELPAAAWGRKGVCKFRLPPPS